MKTQKLLKVISIILAMIMLVQIIPTSVVALAADELTEAETIAPDISDEVEETPEAVILGEDESRREESVKHYIMSDHTYKAVRYSSPVHYEQDGEWVDINNTLAGEEAQDSDDVNGFVNKSNGFKIKFAKKSNGKKLVSIKKDKYGLSWGYDSNSKNKVDAVIKEKAEADSQFSEYVANTSSSVVYENIDTNLSLEYNVIGNTVKENIIVESKSDEYTYNFELKAQNVTFKTNEDGSIDVLAEDTGELVFAIPTPFMYDAENRISNDVHYTLTEQNGNKYILTVTADADWINSENTISPVTIDPMIETERSRDDIDSTFVASANAYKTQNMIGIHNLYVGWETAYYQHTRTLIKFNLPDLNKGDMIVSATLSLMFNDVDFYGNATVDQQIDAHVITSSWNCSTATWNNQPNYDEDVIYDYDYIKRSDIGYNRNKRFDITKAVKAWHEGEISNNGILIKQHTEDGEMPETAAHIIFDSERYTNVESNFPIIAISYLNNKGLENHWSYTSIGVEDAGTAYINDYTGNLVFVNEIASISSERSDLSLKYIYNGYAAGTKFIAKGNNVNTSAGQGWIINILQTIRPSSLYGLTGTKASNYPYVYTDGDGTEHYIYKKEENGSVKYVDEEGLGLTLTLGGSSDTWKYRLTDEDDNVYSFNSKGNLYEMSDANGNKTIVTYDSTGIILKKVTDAVGHTYTFTQSSDAQYITTITDTSGRVTSFNYGGNGKPAKITFPDETYVNYTYDEDNCLKTATASSGYKITFEYNETSKGKRVKSVTESGSDGTEGQVITFDRSKYNTTTITTNGIDGVSETADDLTTTYQFDNFGRTITQKVTSADGEESVAGMYNYISLDEDTRDNVRQVNKVTSDASLGKNVVNLVSEVNGETKSKWQTSTKTSTASFDSSATDKYVGAKSLAITLSALSAEKGNGLFYQDITNVTAGKTYTFSAYVKTTGINQKYSGAPVGAYLQLRTYGTTQTDYFSDALSKTTSTAMNNGWRKLSVTVTMPYDITKIRVFLALRNVTGIAYFDCIQVEESDTVNDCNLLENAGFETASSGVPAKWSTTTATATGDGSSTTSPYDGSKVVKITGDSSTIKNYKQVVNVFGSADDTYIVSGWAKADAVSQLYHEKALFEVGVLVQYAETFEGEIYTEAKEAAKFNTSISDWQYATQAFTLKSKDHPDFTPQYVTVYVKYNYQANCAYFDNIQLIKDVAQTYTYNDEGELISVAANAEQESQMEYTDSNLTKYTDSKGYNYTYIYDDNHNLTKATSAKGVVTGYTYNSYGQVETAELRNKEDSSEATVAIKAETCYYGVTDGISAGSYVNKTFDSHGRETKYVYDVKKGLLNSVETPDKVETEYTYNAHNDNLETVSSVGTTVSYGYTDNHLSSIQIFEPYVDEEYSFTYDAFGNVKQTKVGSTALSTNNYGSNNGVLQSTSYGNGDTVSYTYDYYGNIIGINQDSTESFKWKYDSSLLPVSHFDYRNNLKYNYDYDSIGRLIRQELRTSDSNNTHIGSTEFSYDVRNNLTGIVNTMGGHEIEQYYSYSTVSTSVNSADYEKDNLPTQYKVSNSRRADYTYDSINRLTSRAFTTDRPINNNYVYWSSNRNENGSTKYRTTLLKYEFIDNDAYFYNYDEVGNITEIQKGERKITDDISSKEMENETAYRSYEYDDYNQLIREDNVTSGKTTLFNYDGLGNILSKEEYDYTEIDTDSLGAAEKVIEYTYSNDGKSGWNNLLTSVDLNGNGTVSSSETISYDAIGNPVTYLGKTLSWFGRQLVTFVNGSKTVTNTYDADGYRGTKTVNNKTTTYQYIDGKLFYEGRSDVKLYYYYDSYGNLAAVRYILPDGENGADKTNKIYYVATNVQGDVLGIYESDGDQVAAYEYDAWGNRTIYSVAQVNGENIFTEVTYSQAVTLNPVFNNSIGYRGYYYDTDIELYYLGSRYYDPVVGRFLNADEQFDLYAELLGYNLFAYCSNNPIQYKDADGNSVTLGTILLGVAISTISVYVGDVVEDALDGKSCLEIIKPNSSVGTYVGAVVSGMIPGASVKMAFCRVVVNSGLKYGIDIGIRKEKVNAIDIATDLVLDIAGEAIGLTSDKLIKLARPKNYSSFKHDISMYLPNITKQQTEIAMHVYGKVVEYVFKTHEIILKILFGALGYEVKKLG